MRYIYDGKFKEILSVDFKNNKKIVEKLNINFVKSLNKNKISKYDLIVDAIFGIGLNRDIQIKSPIYKIIKLINKSKKYMFFRLPVWALFYYR